MSCGKCGNQDPGCAKMKSGAKVFFVRMRTVFEKYSNVPCHVRNFFKKSKHLLAKALDGDLYHFQLKKTGPKIRIRGAEYEMFLEDYNMRHNYKIKFEIIHNESYLSMTPLGSNGSIIAKVEEEEEDLDDSDEGEEEYGIEANARAIVLPKGMKLLPYMVDMINGRVTERGVGLRAIFVHRMTSSDIYNNGLRIPKHIVSVLGIRRSGVAYLETNGTEYEAEYFTAADKRIRFRSGWMQFADEFEIQEDDIALIMFYMIEDFLQITFDFLN